MKQETPQVPHDLVKSVAEITGTTDLEAFYSVIQNTIMPSGKSVSNQQMTAFLMVAKEYNLNPITKEIYAFPAKGGGIQPIVGVDGWMKIINSHPQFDGMESIDNKDENGNLASITCRIFRKDRAHAIEVTEYMNECQGKTEDNHGNKTPWGRWPARMLRHKATIQAARYAFGFSGIVDEDEALRIAPRDSDIEAQSSDVITVEQVNEFKELCTKAGKDEKRTVGWVSDGATDDIAKLNNDQWEKACSALKRSVNKQADENTTVDAEYAEVVEEVKQTPPPQTTSIMDGQSVPF